MHFDPRCFGVLFPRSSAVVQVSVFVFLDGGHACFRVFYSTIPVDVVDVAVDL